MAKPRVFISSTFYDLKQIRSDIDSFIHSLGYESIRNEEGNIPYGKTDALETYCYKEIKSIDILISIIGGRFGSESQKGNSSISQLELKTAHNENKQVYIFIENSVLSEYETYLLNQDKDMKYKYVDDIRIYEFIKEIKNLNANNNIKGFERASDITKYLKEQFAGLFQRFLEEQTRTKEVSLISSLEKTSQTLNKMVNYLSEKNEGHEKEINRILMINHPLVEELSEKLSIPYNFYIEEYSDLNKLLSARKYIEEIFESDIKYYEWVFQDSSQEKKVLMISKELFENDKKLKFIKKSDWNSNYVLLETHEIKEEEEDDEFPF